MDNKKIIAGNKFGVFVYNYEYEVGDQVVEPEYISDLSSELTDDYFINLESAITYSDELVAVQEEQSNIVYVDIWQVNEFGNKIEEVSEVPGSSIEEPAWSNWNKDTQQMVEDEAYDKQESAIMEEEIYSSEIDAAKITKDAQEFINKKIKYLIDKEGKTQKAAVGEAYGLAREAGYDVPEKKTKASDKIKADDIDTIMKRHADKLGGYPMKIQVWKISKNEDDIDKLPEKEREHIFNTEGDGVYFAIEGDKITIFPDAVDTKPLMKEKFKDRKSAANGLEKIIGTNIWTAWSISFEGDKFYPFKGFKKTKASEKINAFDFTMNQDLEIGDMVQYGSIVGKVTVINRVQDVYSSEEEFDRYDETYNLTEDSLSWEGNQIMTVMVEYDDIESEKFVYEIKEVEPGLEPIKSSTHKCPHCGTEYEE